jgi:adenosine deaminase
MTSILLTTMGTTWQIPPELIGFTNPGLVDLYRFHPFRDSIQKTRAENDIQPVDALWIITTTGRVNPEVQKVKNWHALLAQPLRLKIWQVAGTDDLGSEAECIRMKEAILRVVLHASECSRDGRLILSLAGGRKTMSSDMQFAASIFGCHALLHVIDHSEFSKSLMEYASRDFLVPIPEVSSNAVTPLVTGRYVRNSLMDMNHDGNPPVRAADYPIDWPDSEKAASLAFSDFSLTEAIRNRLKNAEFLSSNYTHSLMISDKGTNFLALYHLSPLVIEDLKSLYIGVHPEKSEKELNWLRRLPKAELHCHLGGVLDAPDLIRVARANQLLLKGHMSQLMPWLSSWKDQLHCSNISELRGLVCFEDIPRSAQGIPEPLAVAAFILMFENEPDLLDELIFGDLRQESAFCGVDFTPYETLGDIQGSRLLQNRESIQETCRILAEKAKAQHISHLEVRCSPVKYQIGSLADVEVVDLIAEEIGSVYPDFSIILTASRHGDKADILKLTDLAKKLLDRPAGCRHLKGFDLAGNETACQARDVRENLLPLMEKCLHITIHAGENVDVKSIWEAVYHLNAERIGHGLTLMENPELMKRFIDKNIAVEMCPSSNFQIVGYRDNFLPETQAQKIYPLKAYLYEGIKVTVNTDNPGISRTNLTQEIHRAARLTPGGLCLWDILKIVRNGFKAAFVDRVDRNRMLRDAERKVIRLVQEGLPS